MFAINFLENLPFLVSPDPDFYCTFARTFVYALLLYFLNHEPLVLLDCHMKTKAFKKTEKVCPLI